MDASSVFAGWSDAQLREYINENGGSAAGVTDRAALVARAVDTSHCVERKVLGASGAGSDTTARGAETVYPDVYGGGAAAAPPGSSQPPAAAPPQAARNGPPVAQVPPPMPPAGGAKKRALLCAANYFNQDCRLNGCLNDSRCIEYLLKTKMGFPADGILCLRDDDPNPVMRPTRHNMFQGFAWLLAGVARGDSLVFHFSGHGSQVPDYSGEELDGRNETICPVDFRSGGMIVDDELNRYLVNPLPEGAKLHAIIDACHSGTALDLPYSAHIQAGWPVWQSEYARPTRAWKGTAGGFAVQFGASQDSQTAAEKRGMAFDGSSTGAATFSFIQAIEHSAANISYGALLGQMDAVLRRATGGGGGGGPPPGLGGILGSLLGDVNYGAMQGQQPVISANYAFDLNAPFRL